MELKEFLSKNNSINHKELINNDEELSKQQFIETLAKEIYSLKKENLKLKNRNLIQRIFNRCPKN